MRCVGRADQIENYLLFLVGDTRWVVDREARGIERTSGDQAWHQEMYFAHCGQRR